MSVVNFKVHSLFILHRIQAGKAALHPPPEPRTIHKAAEHYWEAECNYDLVDEEHQYENLVKPTTVFHCFEAHRKAKYKDGDRKQICYN